METRCPCCSPLNRPKYISPTTASFIEHPLPLAVAGALLGLWAALALLLAASEGVLSLCARQNAWQHDLERYQREDLDEDGKVVRSCFDRAAYDFYLSTQPTGDFMRRAILLLPPNEGNHNIDAATNSGGNCFCACQWLCDPRIGAVFRANMGMYMLQQHHLLSIWFHHPLDVRDLTLSIE